MLKIYNSVCQYSFTYLIVSKFPMWFVTNVPVQSLLLASCFSLVPKSYIGAASLLSMILSVKSMLSLIVEYILVANTRSARKQ